MKFTTTPSALKAAFSAVSNALNSKSAMPILDNILFRPTDDAQSMQLVASDGDITVTYGIAIDDAEQLSAFTIPSGILKDYISSIATDLPITFEVIGNEIRISDIFCEGYDGAFQFVSSASADEYPVQRPLHDNAKHFSMASARYCDAISSAIPYCSNDDLRPIMCGVYSAFQADRVTIAASDSKKLFREYIPLDPAPVPNADASGSATVPVGLAADEHVDIVLPKKLVSIIASIIDRSKDMQISCDDKTILFQQDNIIICGRRIEGRYPRFEAIIPRNNHRQAIVNRKLFISAIKRVMIAASNTTQCIAFDFDGSGSISLESQDVDYSTHANLRIPTIEQKDCHIRIGMRGNYLNDVLGSFRSNERVRISMFDPTRAVTVTSIDNDDRLCLLMPMQLVDF